MNIRKLLKHRAELSHRKHWMWMRKNGKLVMWWKSPDYR